MTLQSPQAPNFGSRFSASEFEEKVNEPLLENDQYLDGRITALEGQINSLPQKYYSGSAPSSAAEKDLWFDNSTSPNRLYYCNVGYSSGPVIGTNWILVGDDAARTDASTAQSSADSATRFLMSDSPPTDCTSGWVWVDTNQVDRAYRCTNTYVQTDGPGGFATVEEYRQNQYVDFDAFPIEKVSELSTEVELKATIAVDNDVPDDASFGDFWVKSDSLFGMKVCTNAYREDDHIDWTAAHEYLVRDVVTYNGNYYVCIQDTTFAQNPNNPSYYQIQGSEYATQSAYKEDQYTDVRDLISKSEAEAAQTSADAKVSFYQGASAPDSDTLGPFIVGDIWFHSTELEFYFCDTAHDGVGVVPANWTKTSSLNAQDDATVNGALTFANALQVFTGAAIDVDGGNVANNLTVQTTPATAKEIVRLEDLSELDSLGVEFSGAPADLNTISEITTEIDNARGVSGTVDGRLGVIENDITIAKSHQAGQIKAFVADIAARDSYSNPSALDVIAVWDDGSGDFRFYQWSGIAYDDVTTFYDKYEIAHRLELDYDSKISSAQSTLQGNIDTVEQSLNDYIGGDTLPDYIANYGTELVVYVSPSGSGDESGVDVANSMGYDDFRTLTIGKVYPFKITMVMDGLGSYGAAGQWPITTDMEIVSYAGGNIEQTIRAENCSLTISGAQPTITPFICPGIQAVDGSHVTINTPIESGGVTDPLVGATGGCLLEIFVASNFHSITLLRNSHAYIANGTFEIGALTLQGNSMLDANNTPLAIGTIRLNGQSCVRVSGLSGFLPAFEVGATVNTAVYSDVDSYVESGSVLVTGPFTNSIVGTEKLWATLGGRIFTETFSGAAVSGASNGVHYNSAKEKLWNIGG